jgi:hypothetical protein
MDDLESRKIGDFQQRRVRGNKGGRVPKEGGMRLDAERMQRVSLGSGNENTVFPLSPRSPFPSAPTALANQLSRWTRSSTSLVASPAEGPKGIPCEDLRLLISGAGFVSARRSPDKRSRRNRWPLIVLDWRTFDEIGISRKV